MLDIGAWDGFYSFEAERRGARHVTALDHFVWCLDIPAQHEYVARSRARGEQLLPYEAVPDLWKPDELPGKRGLDLAHELLGSTVDVVVADFTTIDPASLGTFDIVFFMDRSIAGLVVHCRP